MISPESRPRLIGAAEISTASRSQRVLPNLGPHAGW